MYEPLTWKDLRQFATAAGFFDGLDEVDLFDPCDPFDVSHDETDGRWDERDLIEVSWLPRGGQGCWVHIAQIRKDLPGQPRLLRLVGRVASVARAVWATTLLGCVIHRLLPRERALELAQMYRARSLEPVA